jgi:hypothetical protein
MKKTVVTNTLTSSARGNRRSAKENSTRVTNRSHLTKEQNAELDALARMPDDEIDVSDPDAPPLPEHAFGFPGRDRHKYVDKRGRLKPEFRRMINKDGSLKPEFRRKSA